MAELEKIRSQEFFSVPSPSHKLTSRGLIMLISWHQVDGLQEAVMPRGEGYRRESKNSRILNVNLNFQMMNVIYWVL